MTTQTSKNREVFNNFASCTYLPYWKDTMCHTTKSHLFDRQVSWEKISEEFSLTRPETKHIKNLYKASVLHGWYCKYKDIKVTHNKARLIKTLTDKHVLKVIEGNRVILNPSILMARVGWSQHMLGIMLYQWTNETFVLPQLASEEDRDSIQAGLNFALADSVQPAIPFRIQGRVEGAINTL